MYLPYITCFLFETVFNFNIRNILLINYIYIMQVDAHQKNKRIKMCFRCYALRVYDVFRLSNDCLLKLM